MTENNHIEELIIRYFESSITENELMILEQWIQQSDENKVEFFELKRIYDSGQLVTYRDENDFEKKWNVLETRIVQSENGKASIKKRSMYSRIIQYAAMLILAIGIGFYINRNDKSGVTVNHISYNEITVAKGGKANTLLLSDGSKVMLNSASHIKYPTSFGTEKREIFLDGEAYLEVAKDKEKPFVVRLKNQDITVLGTTLNIQSYDHEKSSVITLIEGQILLESYDTDGEKMSQVYMKPNQQAYTDNETGSVFLTNVDVSISSAWKDGKYKFKDESLSVIMKRLENYYGVNIFLADDSLKDIRYTGTFSLNQSIEDVLRVINAERKFKIRIENDEITLSTKI